MDNGKSLENTYFPIFVDLRGSLVVVVGGGMVAARKVESLVKAGASVMVIAPKVVPEIASLPEVLVETREYEEDDLEGAQLVIAATDSEVINRQVSEDARQRNIFCNVVDRPELCSFIVPSVVERGPIKVAISTGGFSPALSRRLRLSIGNSIGDEYVTMAAILGTIRPLVRSMPGGSDDHRRIFELLIDSDLLDAIRTGDRPRAEDVLFQALGMRIDLREIMP
ncbi:MAG TPA: bifunctional precorrin-2 dehydrogenase/sirohydrochlorin ferrochelatase [Deltaproteobacteria bacterium]|nr:bifunctional precorrin-2 dehydrogenase/sirohydrochlorin ferrochelatase [Deltaproteobacteria bacterium]